MFDRREETKLFHGGGGAGGHIGNLGHFFILTYTEIKNAPVARASI